jgi:16S rRNA (cytosine1402-N4)-methyltransferase
MDSQLPKPLRALGKAMRAESQEVGENLRSRSAVMRIAEKLG